MKHKGKNLSRTDYRVVAGSPLRPLLDLVRALHYSGSASHAAVARFGLLRVSDDRLVGAALFMAQRKSAAQTFWEGDHKRVLCLSRLALDPEVPRNGASFFLGQCIRQLRETGRYDCLTTYADTWQGHTGAIYRATNWEYLGTTPPRAKWINADGHLASRKHGRRNRSVEEMNQLGYYRAGNSVKHKFRFIL